jgi:hypothetical protein
MKVVIHPGFSKTATTTLQHHFFSNHLDIVNVAEPYTADTVKFGIEIKKPHGRFDKSELKKLFDAIVTYHIENTAAWKRVMVFSDEEFTIDDTTRALIAERLHDLMPEATIVFTIRNQIEWIKSFYASAATQGRFLARYKIGRYASLDDWLQYSIDNWYQSFICSIEYDRVVRWYENLFGRDRIHILLYENFSENLAGFINQLCGILEIDPDQSVETLKKTRANQRPTRMYHTYHKVRHWILPNVTIQKLVRRADSVHRILSKALMRDAPYTVEFPPKWERVLRAKFAEGNRELALRYGLPLRELDYPFLEHAVLDNRLISVGESP